jgi:hypothetical protein
MKSGIVDLIRSENLGDKRRENTIGLNLLTIDDVVFRPSVFLPFLFFFLFFKIYIYKINIYK